MTPAPDISFVGQRLVDRTEPLAPDDETYDWAHRHLCEALMAAFRQVAEIADPEDDAIPPLAPLMDVDLAPSWALPWVGQLVGVRLPEGLTEEAQRDYIRNTGGFKRGTEAAIRAAAQSALTGDKTMYFRERDPTPYELTIVTRTGETPDVALLTALVMAQKPAGIKVVLNQVAVWDYAEMTTEGGTYAAQTAAYADYEALALKEPI